MIKRKESQLNRADHHTLTAFMAEIRKDYPYFIGFPGSVDFDYSELLPFFQYLLNNVGDPYVSPLHANHSKRLEREVVDFFADLFHAPKSDRWGYVTNGGTEGNLYSLYVARELYPEAPVFYSNSAHYSIPKNIGILGMQGIAVASEESGEMDYSSLKKNIIKSGATQVIVVATIGTTMSRQRTMCTLFSTSSMTSALMMHHLCTVMQRWQASIQPLQFPIIRLILLTVQMRSVSADTNLSDARCRAEW